MKKILQKFPSTIKILLYIAAAALIIGYFSFQTFTVSGNSMEPTLNDGSKVLLDTIRYHVHIARGDIIVFHDPHGGPVIDIKRVIGLPNETVHISNTQIVIEHKDGSKETFPEDSIIGRDSNGSDHNTVLGPEDYFVMGDNRSFSTDSRSWGTVQRVNIIGTMMKAL